MDAELHSSTCTRQVEAVCVLLSRLLRTDFCQALLLRKVLYLRRTPTEYICTYSSKVPDLSA